MAKKKRKTREEKIISQLRRELQEAKKNQPEVKIKTKKPKPQTINLKPLASRPKDRPGDDGPLDHDQPLADNLYLKKDLTKSLALAILAIGFVCLAYFLKNVINFLP